MSDRFEEYAEARRCILQLLAAMNEVIFDDLTSLAEIACFLLATTHVRW